MIHFGASIDWKGNMFAYMGACKSGRYGPDPRKGKGEKGRVAFGRCLYSFNVKTKIPPLSTFL
jgi:hypothetical protein